MDFKAITAFIIWHDDQMKVFNPDDTGSLPDDVIAPYIASGQAEKAKGKKGKKSEAKPEPDAETETEAETEADAEAEAEATEDAGEPAGEIEAAPIA